MPGVLCSVARWQVSDDESALVHAFLPQRVVVHRKGEEQVHDLFRLDGWFQVSTWLLALRDGFARCPAVCRFGTAVLLAARDRDSEEGLLSDERQAQSGLVGTDVLFPNPFRALPPGTIGERWLGEQCADRTDTHHFDCLLHFFSVNVL